MLFLISLLYISYKFIQEESGNGDLYREWANNPHNSPEVRKAYMKRASESDGAVAFGWMVWIGFGILVLVTLCQ